MHRPVLVGLQAKTVQNGSKEIYWCILIKGLIFIVYAS